MPLLFSLEVADSQTYWRLLALLATQIADIIIITPYIATAAIADE